MTHVGKYTSPTWFLWVWTTLPSPHHLLSSFLRSGNISGNSKLITLHKGHYITNPNNACLRSVKGKSCKITMHFSIKFDAPSRDTVCCWYLVRRNWFLFFWVLIYLRSSSKKHHGYGSEQRRQSTFRSKVLQSSGSFRCWESTGMPMEVSN